MTSYYLIPTLDTGIIFNHQELKTATTIRSPKIANLENKRISMIYGIPMDRNFTIKEREKYSKLIEIIKDEFKKESYPQYLLATGNPKKAIEISTKLPITAKFDAAIAIREVTKNQFLTYINENPEYEKTVKHYLELPNNIIDFNSSKKRLNKKK